MNDLLPRGLTASQAASYLGISRRDFATNWRPQLAWMPSGTRLICDRLSLDALFVSRLTRASDGQARPVCSSNELAQLKDVLRDCRNRKRMAGKS